MNGHHIRLKTSSRKEKTKSIYYERSSHQIEYILNTKKQKAYTVNGHASDSTHHLNTRKQKAYIINGHHIRLNT